MTNTHATKALAHLDAAQAHRDHLDELYESSQQQPAMVARLHQHIGLGLKLAAVHAQLAVAEAITSGHECTLCGKAVKA